MPKPAVTITGYSWPYDHWYDRYQAYYVSGLKHCLAQRGQNYREISLSRWPGLVRKLRSARDSYKLQHLLGNKEHSFFFRLDAMAGLLLNKPKDASPLLNTDVGQYVATASDGRVVPFCIDCDDHSEVHSPNHQRWSQIYFKGNYWKDLAYPPNVRPLINGNPHVLGHLDTLRAARNCPKEYDVCFIVRVWGGSSRAAGIEHILCLLEAVNRLPCKKYLLAYLVTGDIETIARRLTAQGIPWTTKPVPLREVWRRSAQARINLLRLGMHFALPWRMIDMLAMGACPVLDHAPFNVWPEPLVEGEHYLNLGVNIGPSQATAPEAQYRLIGEKIQSWLTQSGLVRQISQNTAEYFDLHATPERIGHHLLNSVLPQDW
jgi:hypothetical protein